ncbi:MAG TPA: D-Ala-D-Ala carboxypeptidase family metallohydrolase [Gemmatimonadaceae bacterium]|nr:D-Ala-D-Ala carboxypeptidase family metallohydrolase [Gemmatimonadaceae bacterium]
MSGLAPEVSQDLGNVVQATFFKRPKPATFVTILLVVAATLGAVQFRSSITPFAVKPFGKFLSEALPIAVPSSTAFGTSGGVLLRFALPGERIRYPLDVHGDPTSLQYDWVRLGETVASGRPQPLVGADVNAPFKAGFYRLALVRGDQLRIIDGLTLAVLVPFKEKEGTMLNGYRIGTYLKEKLAGNQDPPAGFLEITERDVSLPISKHLRVGDFLSHDNQQTWPRYAAVSPRLLDKLELVISEIMRWHGSAAPRSLALDVHSGFRAPAYNSRIRRAARDSQHQYGDAADLILDANGDGKLTSLDSRMVGLAVEIVELKHPELVGGLGVYTSGHARTTYVHIDARGKRARWRG